MKGETFALLQSKERFNVYYKYLDKLIDVQEIEFGGYSNTRNTNKKLKVEKLSINQVKDSIRLIHQFIVNENPDFILTVSQSSYQIPKAVKATQEPGQKPSQR
jgi:hypothetical protein